ncbi:TonB-dependent receptor plug domain-containing protein [Dyella nitratireducens]|uniref:TonB-dependent receptor n=1 Tax=Dyella nitratireducens TaxID=1849580 RepID=A0ABQ1GF14_9GAMM|nr:TonB-dependent receptor [Dyella nitratireducens]GGA42382.1 TonB-dependent receptor [Dyella nitratireducens]GLQ42009.1 TonB-dependent receptor [Dyella nitratireducens]
MKDLRHKSLCLLICASLAGSIGHAGVVAAQTANDSSAPDTQGKPLQVIQVTGSLIRSVDIEQAQPVVTISAQDIQHQGFATLGQLLQNLTSTSTADISKSNPSDASTDVGGSYADLRGLGSTRTLILIDGKRVGSSYTGMTNLDTIPVSIIDHVDVLADGASAVYGSDAIGGVINVITKKDFNGAQIDMYEGKYMPHGDGTQGQYGVTFGKSNARGSILFSAQYQNQDGISANRRPYSAYPLTDRFPLNGLGEGAYGSFVNANGGISVLNTGGDPRNINDYHALVQPTVAANGVTTNAGDSYNYSNQVSLLSATTMKNMFLAGQYNISDNLSAHFNAAFNQDDNTSELGGFPLSSSSITSSVPQYNNLLLSAQSYYNPTNADGQTPTDLSFQRYVEELPRQTINKQENVRFSLGLQGYFQLGEHQFSWNADYYDTRYTGTVITQGNFYLPHLANALGPSFLASNGTVECGTPGNVMAGCVPLNALAGPGGYTTSMLDYIAVPTYEHYGSSEKGPQIDISGDVLELPAGEVNVAAGATHRSVSGYDTPDLNSMEGLTTNLSGQPTRGGYGVNEAYGEVSVPVLRDLPMAKSLNVDVASRFSHYTNFGNTHNNQYKLSWKPIDDLLVRASYGSGFRAPAVADLYGGVSTTYPSYTDPCDVTYGLARYNATVAKNCANGTGGQPALSKQALSAAGLGSEYTNGFMQEQAPGTPTTSPGGYPVYQPFTVGGNARLRPETSKSKQLGFVYSPGYLPGFNATVDWFDYKVRNVISYISPDEVLYNCYALAIARDCGLFQRSASNDYQVSGLFMGEENQGFMRATGYDVNLSYALPKFSFGEFKLISQSTYYTRNENQQYDNTPVTSNNGIGSSWRVRSNFTVSWNYHDFGADWTLRYYSPLKDSCYNPQYSAFPCTLPNYYQPGVGITPMTQVPSVTFNDAQVHWKSPWGGVIALGMNNVFNRKGPYVYGSGTNTGSDTMYSYNASYDYGRFVYLRYTQKF